MAITRKVSEIINHAYKLIGYFSTDNDFSSEDSKDAFYLLNNILMSLPTDLIPYCETKEFTVSVGKRDYTIGPSGQDVTANKLTYLKYVNLISNNLSYPVTVETDYNFFKKDTNLNSIGRPCSCFIQESNNLTTLSFYIKPDYNYTCQLKGLFQVDTVSRLYYTFDIDFLPPEFFDYLAYKLGYRMKDLKPTTSWNNGKTTEMKLLEDKVSDMGDLDLTTNCDNAMVKSQHIDANLDTV